MPRTKKTQEITEAVKKAVDAAEPIIEKAEVKGEETVETVKKTTKKAVKTVKKSAGKLAEKKVFLQYQNGEFDLDAVIEKAAAVYNEIDGADVIRSIKIYVKPEEYAAYYVINDKDTGRIDL